MSERIKKAVGSVLAAGCLITCLLPLADTLRENAAVFRSRGDQGWFLPEIRTEQNGPIRVNTADAETLQLLPGIGQAFADRIIRERGENGPYYYPEDLEAVSGIGPQTLRKFRSMLDMRLNESED